MHQFQVIKQFEEALAKYTGAPYVCCVNSCTMALRLCLDWKYRQLAPLRKVHYVEIPKKTYVSVPIQIKLAGFKVKFREDDWKGWYGLDDLDIIDSARRFRAQMFNNICDCSTGPRTYVCVSFHYTKILGLNHGGAILHDDPHALHFFREMRHDGRVEGMPIADHRMQYLGHHCPMSVETAAQGLVKLASLPEHNEDLPNSNYPDLSKFRIFK